MSRGVHPLVKSLPLFLVIFIDGAGLGLVFPILNSLFIDVHSTFLPAATSMSVRNFDYGLVVGIFMLCWFFGAAIISDLSDSMGRKKCLFICLVGAFIGYGLSGLAIYFHSIALLVLGRIIAGFTAGSQPVAQASIVDVSTPENKARYLGYTLLAVSLGFIVGPIIGGVLSDSHFVSWFNFSVPMYFAALLSFINIFFLLGLYKESSTHTRKIRIQLSLAVTLFISAFRDRTVRILSISFFIFILAWANYYTYTSMYALKNFHFTPLDTTMLMAVMGVGFAVGMGYLTGVCEKMFGLKKSAIGGLVLSFVFIILNLIIHKAWACWVFTAPSAAAVSVSYVSMLTIFSGQVDETRQGWVMGITGAIMALSFAIMSFAGSFFSDLNPNVPYWVAGVGLLIAGITLLPQRLSASS